MALQFQFGKWSAVVYGALVEIRLKGADAREFSTEGQCEGNATLNFFSYLNLEQAESLLAELQAAVKAARKARAGPPPGAETPQSIRRRIRRWLGG
jgi:hypothetical protein